MRSRILVPRDLVSIDIITRVMSLSNLIKGESFPLSMRCYSVFSDSSCAPNCYRNVETICSQLGSFFAVSNVLDPSRLRWPRVLRHSHCLRTLEHWGRGFESHSRHGCLYCVRLFGVCVVLRVVRGLSMG
jgi:hypothetical protein